ncbi:MAG: Holliday junction resolvase RuvX [Pseudomonadota bacterium]
MPTPGPLLALDVGTQTIGIATCDPGRILARPVSTLARKGVRQDVARLVPIAADLGVVGLVVGLPLALDGGETRSVRLARQVGDALAAAMGLPLVYHDERFSSVEAERVLIAQGRSRQRRKGTIDQAAAAVILQDFLDSSESAGFAIEPG